MDSQCKITCLLDQTFIPTRSFPDSFDEVGTGTKDILIREASGIYRVMYVAKFEEAVYVLHCFQKKTQATSKQD